MQYFVHVDKKTKRVMGTSSTSSGNDVYLEIQIDDENSIYNELILNPFIFVYDELTKMFIKDVEYQNKLINEKKKNISNDEKINALMQSLATYMIDSIKNKKEKELLMKNQANLMLEMMKLKGSNSNGK